MASCTARIFFVFSLLLFGIPALAQEGVEPASRSKLTEIQLPEALRLTDPEQLSQVLPLLDAIAKEAMAKRADPEVLLWGGAGYRRASAAPVMRAVGERMKAAGYAYQTREGQSQDGTEIRLLAAARGEENVAGAWLVSDQALVLAWCRLVTGAQPAPAKPAVGAEGAQVLVPGETPLTRKMVEDFSHFIAWLLETPLTLEQRDKIEASMAADWKKRDQNSINGVLEALKVREQVWKLSEAERALVRKQIQPELLKELRAQKDETARWLLAIYESAHRPLAPGDPPLTRQMTDAYAEVMFFMLSEVAGESLPADRALKDAWAKSLAADYPKMPAGVRQNLGKMPLFSAALRVAWPLLPADEREAYMKEWTALFREMLPAAGPAAKPASGGQKQAGASKPTPAGKAGSPTASDLLQQVQRQQQAYQMMSQMSMQMHYSRINALNTLGGNPYRYVNGYGVPY